MARVLHPVSMTRILGLMAGFLMRLTGRGRFLVFLVAPSEYSAFAIIMSAMIIIANILILYVVVRNSETL